MFVQDVRELAPEILRRVLEHLNDPAETGGYMTVWQMEIPDVIIQPELVGEVANGQDALYRAFCAEKACRLYEMHHLNGHLSSWQSQDPEGGKYAGAIIAFDDARRRYLFSFSGLPASYDEAAMLLLAVRMGMSRAKAEEVARISGNQVFFDLLGEPKER
jgi:hypothetical protein